MRWQPWTPREVADRFAGFTTPWCVVGGWALDLWHGRQTRAHEDIEIAIPRLRLAEARRTLPDHEFWTASNGTLAATPPTADQHQNWVLDPIASVWRVDIFLEPGDDATWIYRRDESLQLPRAETFAVTADGIPYLRPELVFLFKAKAMRPKDELDFATARPRLDLAWLHRLLDPNHPWLRT
jgi:Aminoglycoside-2''-adenylyltransferase